MKYFQVYTTLEMGIAWAYAIELGVTMHGDQSYMGAEGLWQIDFLPLVKGVAGCSRGHVHAHQVFYHWPTPLVSLSPLMDSNCVIIEDELFNARKSLWKQEH